VREAQECVELFLKRVLRLVGVEPVLRREPGRFPPWFRAQVDHLAGISTELAGDRGIAFYGDERQELGPQDLIKEDDARRPLGNLEFVAEQCERLLAEAAGSTGEQTLRSS
jgi:hypothetical protein